MAGLIYVDCDYFIRYNIISLFNSKKVWKSIAYTIENSSLLISAGTVKAI